MKRDCIFFDPCQHVEADVLLKELVLRGYRLLPLSAGGILVISNTQKSVRAIDESRGG